MRSIAIQIVYKCEFVGIPKSITLKSLREGIESSSEHHGAVPDLVLLTGQAECVDFDSIFAQALVIQGITVFGEVDMFERSDDKANVLGEDGSVA